MSLSPVNLLDDSNFKEFIDAFLAVAKSCENVPLDEERRRSDQFFSLNAVYEPVHRIENKMILGSDGTQIPLRIYVPDDSKDLSTIVYFHRGGWVFGNIEAADSICRKLANHLKSMIVSVDYRLAPENPFPKPLNDCYDATLWVSENIHQYNGDNKKIIVCGESAGGNLAAAVTLMARDKKGPSLAGQLLIYPVISSSLSKTSYETCADQYFLTKDTMTYFLSMYLPSPEDANNPYASPDLATDFTGLPPALIITAEHDPLHQQGEDYANSLRKANVKALWKCYPDVIHGFIDLPFYSENQKNAWIDEIGKLLQDLL